MNTDNKKKTRIAIAIVVACTLLQGQTSHANEPRAVACSVKLESKQMLDLPLDRKRIRDESGKVIQEVHQLKHKHYLFEAIHYLVDGDGLAVQTKADSIFLMVASDTFFMGGFPTLKSNGSLTPFVNSNQEGAYVRVYSNIEGHGDLTLICQREIDPAKVNSSKVTKRIRNPNIGRDANN